MGHLWVKIQTVELGEWWTVKYRRVCHAHGFAWVNLHNLRFFYMTRGRMKLIQVVWKFKQLVNCRVRIWSQGSTLNPKGSRLRMCLMQLLVAVILQDPGMFWKTVGWLSCTWKGDCFLRLNIYMLGAVMWHWGLSWQPRERSLLQDVRLQLKWTSELPLNRVIPTKAF